MTDDGAHQPGDGGLDAREAARIARRDRDADAAARDLMRPGMGKVFKQILDAQGKAAEAPAKSPKRRKGKRG
jgi:anti-sigma factor RsiW